jgi:CHAT domain-containing protein
MMNEIMQLNLNADLVILSACNTASVEDQYSGSYSGLAKAFFVAGAKSVLVSNWFVEDTATQKLIKKFMENISKNEVNFSENLNLTMKELSKQKNQGSHPIFWAPFVFVGTDKEIIKNLN